MKFTSFITYFLKTGSLVLVFFLASLVVAQARHAEDVELWTFVGVDTEWKKVEFSITHANFFKPEFGRFLNFTQFSFDFINNRSINFGVAYKQEYLELGDFKRTEYRPMLHGYYTKELGNFEFSDRNRMEFRIMEGKMFNRYRNRIQLEYNVRDKVIPYVSTAAFFYFNEFRYSRQRTTLGAVIPIKSVALNVFGVHQVDRFLPDTNFEVWYNRFILGTSLSYSF